MNFKFPSITLAQLVAAVTFVVGQIVTWGWVDNDTGQWVLSIVIAGLTMSWQLADAFLRGKRAMAVAHAAAATGAMPTVEKTLVS